MTTATPPTDAAPSTRKGRYVTGRMVQEMRAARAAGESYATIAAWHDVADRTVMLHTVGVFDRKPCRPRSFDYDKANWLRKQGLTLSEIGRRLGVTDSAICKVLRKISP